MEDDEGTRDTTVHGCFMPFFFLSYFINRKLLYTRDGSHQTRRDTRAGKREAAQIHYMIDTPPFYTIRCTGVDRQKLKLLLFF